MTGPLLGPMNPLRRYFVTGASLRYGFEVPDVLRMPKTPERQREYVRAHYEHNKDYYVKKAAVQKAETMTYVRKQKTKPCADCGQSYPYYVMDFDHARGTKLAEISTLARRGATKKLREELPKCDVVCANCHRIRTFNRSTPRW